MPELPTPHLNKLKACLDNQRLPAADRERVKEALGRYGEWINALNSVVRGDGRAIEELIAATNKYKRHIDLDLIFDSPEDFLYRQRGQLKLDNTVLEEFLPHLVFKSLANLDCAYQLGPGKTFSGLSFSSSFRNFGAGGFPVLREKDQDFILGRKLFIKTAFSKEFDDHELIHSYLGYVCAECKTNLDKTMFQEAVATSRDLKMAVPSSMYFLICEFLDMTPTAIASTHIDDVLIVRKAKRMSSALRQKYRSSAARKKNRLEYIDFIDRSQYHPDVFRGMIDTISSRLDEQDPQLDDVLKRGSFRN